MRGLCTSLILAAGLLGGSAAQATVNWSWSFTQNTLNLAQSRSIDVTITNLSSSDESITRAFIDFETFGDFGVLTDPSNGHLVTPSLRSLQSPLVPGQSVTFEALTFMFSGDSHGVLLPSTTFSQTIAPSMKFWTSSSCNFSGCEQTKLGDNSLTLIYAPVPEAAAWSLWLAGLAGLAAFCRRRRAQVGR